PTINFHRNQASTAKTLKVFSLLVVVEPKPESGGRRNRFGTGGPTAVDRIACDGTY
ncbi:unnamed protein product, partial [Linum tenue]